MKPILISLLAIFAISVSAKELPIAKPEREGMSSDRLQRVAAMNDRYTNSGRIAGTATAVVRNGKVVHVSTSGKKKV
jgi:hypothetical protein